MITEIRQKQNGGHFQPWQPMYSQVAEGGTLQMGIYNLFADYWCMICLDCYEQACQTGTFEHFYLSLKIQNGRRQLMQNRRISWVWGRNLGVIAENWHEYPLYRSPKILHESYVAFGRKTAKIEKNRFLTSNTIIKYVISDWFWSVEPTSGP